MGIDGHLKRRIAQGFRPAIQGSVRLAWFSLGRRNMGGTETWGPRMATISAAACFHLDSCEELSTLASSGLIDALSINSRLAREGPQNRDAHLRGCASAPRRIDKDLHLRIAWLNHIQCRLRSISFDPLHSTSRHATPLHSHVLRSLIL